MPANDSTPSEGKEPAESIEYDTERELRRLVKAQSEFLYDLAHPANVDDDLDEIADRYRQLSREAAFLARVVEELRPGE